MKTKMTKMVIKSVMVAAFMLGAVICMREKPSSAYSVLPYYDPIDGTIKDERIFSNSKVTDKDTTWNGTRICTGEVTIDTRVTVKGDVKLILADSCRLTIPKGITVEKGNSLTIYAMENGEGRLYAGTNGDGEIRLCDDGNAGIGGTRGKDCTEKGHDGVEGNSAWWARTMKVNSSGRYVQVIRHAADPGTIGENGSDGEDGQDAGRIIINGGVITARGGKDGAGIGGGAGGNGSDGGNGGKGGDALRAPRGTRGDVYQAARGGRGGAGGEGGNGGNGGRGGKNGLGGKNGGHGESGQAGQDGDADTIVINGGTLNADDDM